MTSCSPLLGMGGFAEVFLGEHLHLGTLAAIKLLYTQPGNTDVEQFRLKARTIARLIHRDIKDDSNLRLTIYLTLSPYTSTIITVSDKGKPDRGM